MQGAERHTGRTFPASSPDERTYSAKIPRFRGNLSLHRISDLYILSYSLPKSKQKRTVKRENFHISQKNVLFKINKLGSKTRCRSAFLDLKSAILRKKCSGTVPQSRSGAFFLSDSEKCGADDSRIVAEFGNLQFRQRHQSASVLFGSHHRFNGGQQAFALVGNTAADGKHLRLKNIDHVGQTRSQIG